MRHYPFNSSVLAPVSHDPGLTKRVLVKEPVSCVRRISHIELAPGQTVTEHSHPGDHEVFYCLAGLLTVSVVSEPVTLAPGDVLVVEPDEAHAIVEVGLPSALLYMRIGRE